MAISIDDYLLITVERSKALRIGTSMTNFPSKNTEPQTLRLRLLGVCFSGEIEPRSHAIRLNTQFDEERRGIANSGLLFARENTNPQRIGLLVKF